MKNSLFSLLLSCSFLATSFAQTPNSPVSELYQFSVQLRADYGSLTRFYVIDQSPERRDRFQTFFEEQLKALAEFDFDKLSVGGQVDYLLTKNYMDDKIYRLEEEKVGYETLKKWVAAGEYLYELEKERRRGKQLDWQQVAQKLNQIANDLKIVSTQLTEEKQRFSKPLAIQAKQIIQGQKKALDSVWEFYNGYDPTFAWWVEKPYLLLSDFLGQYATLLREQVDPATLAKDDGSGIIGNPIGRKELIRLLEHEMIPYTPEQLVEIANKEFAWCDAELLKASQEMGFGDDWKKAQEKVKQSFVSPGEQPETMFRLYNESIDFLKKNELLTIPAIAEETWRMVMIPPKRQLISPFFLGGEVLQIAYPTDEMNHEDKLMSMRGNNPHFARAVIHHELIAGHHLQFFMNERHHAYRNYRTPFWVEGWALYWEMLLWEKGFAQSPEDKIGMLFWRMHRCARIIFSLNYHLEKWSPQQCIDFLVDRVGHERANAAGEVRRSFTGGYGPLYQIAYMLGGLQFRALKEEFVDSKKMTFKTFHDTIMKENAMPVEMVRAILKNEPLKKDFKSSWKFYQAIQKK